MYPLQVTEVLREMIAANMPVLLHGKPGVGKTDLATSAARDVGFRTVLSHPVTYDPTDVKGLPWVVDGSALFLPMGEMAEVLTAQEPTVWIIDDLGQAAVAVQAALMQYLLARRLGAHQLPPHVSIVACTNGRGHRAGVGQFLAPLLSRFASVLEVEAHLPSWEAWAFSADIRPEVLAFLRFRPDLLAPDGDAGRDLEPFPCPRTWARVSSLLELFQDAGHLHMPVFGGAVGRGVAAEFVGFLRVWGSMVSLDSILADPEGAPFPNRADERFAVATGLAKLTTPANVSRVARYAERLATAGDGVTAGLILRDCQRRNPALMMGFTQVLAGPVGALIMGDV